MNFEFETIIECTGAESYSFTNDANQLVEGGKISYLRRFENGSVKEVTFVCEYSIADKIKNRDEFPVNLDIVFDLSDLSKRPVVKTITIAK